MGKWWALTCKYRLIHRSIAGAISLLGRNRNFRTMRVNCATILPCLALPQGRVSIFQKETQNVQIMIEIIVDGSKCWMDNTIKWTSTERQQFVVLKVWELNFDLVTVIRNWVITNFHRQRKYQQGHNPILRMSVHGAWMNFSFPSWVIHLPIGCRHPFMRYWLPLGAKKTATRSLPHSEK